MKTKTEKYKDGLQQTRYRLVIRIYGYIIGKKSFITFPLIAVILYLLPLSHFYSTEPLAGLIRALSTISPNIISTDIANFPDPKRVAAFLCILNMIGICLSVYVALVTKLFVEYKKINLKSISLWQGIKGISIVLITLFSGLAISFFDVGAGGTEGNYFSNHFFYYVSFRTFIWFGNLYFVSILRLGFMITKWKNA